VIADLVLEEVYAGYDQADVLTGVSLTARAGQITCILGSNGSGKSTLIRTVLGLTPARRGRILFGGRDLTALPTHEVIATGIACIPEGRKVFPKLTVLENLSIGAYQERNRQTIQERERRVLQVFPRLRERQYQLAGTLSGGEQAMLSIGRGLMASPRLLIIDEPSLGLSPLYVKENFRIIEQVNQTGITVLLVEQNVRQTLSIADYGYVLSQGRVAAHGTAQELGSSAQVQQAYFG
jgi:branched-chain amino acid transport system ATP-binding protein